MDSVKALSEGVRNSMRSGIIIYDLSRVVEELVFNSLDAGASKVSVYVGVRTCFVKVVDDGCGITREGLVLLGERYVTSKFHHPADVDSANRSYGFRGEALASISEISLLEIVTKTCGRPNGYCKITKGSKCLYLGINDDRKDAGTTVVVRDLFYNQPVRNKYLHSRPKKVMNSVKKCVYRIALVHPKVSFKVIDIESEDELLYMHHSSALSRLVIGFGIEDSSSLLELNVKDGDFHLIGYISRPDNGFATKVFQYVYINSRFVCKGPIHQLLSNLPTRLEHLDPQKTNSLSQKGKRSRPETYLAYILNLHCSSSLYDLNFEPSKTSAEFKDWVPILGFIEKIIQQIWGENITYGESSSHAADIFQKDETWKECQDMASVGDLFDRDLAKNSEFKRMKCEIQKCQSSHHLASSSSLEILRKEVDHDFNGDRERVPYEEFHMNVSEFKEQPVGKNALCQSDHSVQSWNGILSKPLFQKNGIDSLISDCSFRFQDNYCLEDKFIDREGFRDHAESHILNSEWQDESPKFESGARSGCDGIVFSFDCLESSNELEVLKNHKKPFLKSCSLGRSLLHDGDVLTSEEGFEFLPDTFKTKRRRFSADENVDMLTNVDVRNQQFDIFPTTLQQNGESHLPEDFYLRSGDSLKSFSSFRNPLAGERGLASGSFIHTESVGSGCHSIYSESCVTSDWGFEHLLDDNDESEGCARHGKRENYWHFADGREKKSKSSFIMSKGSSQDNSISSSKSSVLGFNNFADFNKYACKFTQERKLCTDFSLEHFGVEDWSLIDLDFKDNKSHDQNTVRRNQLRCQDWEQDHIPRKRPMRSHSAPPFYRNKRRFISLDNHLMVEDGKTHAHSTVTSTEADKLKHLYFHPNITKDSDFSTSPNTKTRPEILLENEIQGGQNFKHPQYSLPQDMSYKGFTSKGIGTSIDSGTKWRNDTKKFAKINATLVDSQHDILNVSTGLLHLAGHSLVPESIHKNCLVDAKVLPQVDKKFIPVVAGGTLAVIDQHAADERIRLEELRQKVLSGEARTISYLDAQKELILPELGYQLLHNYHEQINGWGWVCNIQAQASGTFKKNLNILHQQPTIVTLLAVPCILGVDLSDGDLLEFIQQLADTDGSSTMPPSVLRVLNYKACRGAIMFGDSLLPSECALIVEELKRTSLCFQCAHGRPTTVPLVNLEALQKQIVRLGAGGDDDSSKLRHQLSRQELSLERAAKRLRAARGHC